MKTRICLAGAAGNVGRQLVKAILASEDLQLTAAIGKTSAGKNLGQVLSEDIDLVVQSTVEQAVEADTDVLIDYTKPDAVKDTVHEAIDRGLHVVVGTSGLTDEDYKEIDAQALDKSVGVLAAGNFSITATLMQHFSLLAVKYLPHWEIFDYAPDTKADAPSGTARELAFQLAGKGKPRWAVPVEDTRGVKESRGATLNGSQVHSVRVPGFYSSSEILFGLPGERLTLRHDSMSCQPYVEGTLLGARKVGSFVGLRRGLASILDIDIET